MEFYILVENIKYMRYIRNFINRRKITKEYLFKSKELLDNVNGYSLDKKQRLAVIDSSDSALLLAGAGSGKTLTIVGKIRYLIEMLKIKKEDILCISFTNDSVNSLKNALLKNYNYDIDVFTFHKLALNILKDNKNIVNIASSDELDYIITEYFYSNFSGLNILEKKEDRGLAIMPKQVYIYGDSLLKATMPDEGYHYHFHYDEVLQRYPERRTQVVNRSKMGATISKGESLVQHDLDRGLEADYALVAYGGNDSDYDWAAIDADPAGNHHPRTELSAFREKLRHTVTMLREKGIQPVLMSLPPIDATRYLAFICRDGLRKERIMDWLGDVQMIYRHQEMYSDAVTQLAYAEDLPLIPVREEFLNDHKLMRLIAADGIHLTMPGYERLFDTLADWLRVRV